MKIEVGQIFYSRHKGSDWNVWHEIMSIDGDIVVMSNYGKETTPVDAIPLPCKVGDEVWCLRDTRVYNKPVKGTVTEIYFRDNMDMCIVVRRLCRADGVRRCLQRSRKDKR